MKTAAKTEVKYAEPQRIIVVKKRNDEKLEAKKRSKSRSASKAAKEISPNVSKTAHGKRTCPIPEISLIDELRAAVSMPPAINTTSETITDQQKGNETTQPTENCANTVPRKKKKTTALPKTSKKHQNADLQPITGLKKVEADNSKKSTTSKPMSTSERKKLANQKRLESLKSRSQATAAMQKLKIDSSGCTSSKKIRLDLDESDEERGKVLEVAREIEGSAKASLLQDPADWLESGDEEATADWTIKPALEGSHGQKLLELKQTYKGDKRFQLDERFADSDSDESNQDQEQIDGAPPSHDSDNEQEAKLRMAVQKEKAAQLAIIQRLAPGASNAPHSAAVAENTPGANAVKASFFVDMNMMQYDPTKASAKDMEIDATVSQEQAQQMKKRRGATVQGHAPLPAVSKERFVEVDMNSLSSLFKPSGDAPRTEAGFSLLGEVSDDGVQSASELSSEDDEESATPTNSVPATFPLADPTEQGPKPQSPLKETQNARLAGLAAANVAGARKNFFFFHLSTPELANRLVAKEGSANDGQLSYDHNDFFICQGTEEDVEKRWKEQRAFLTHQFKSKNKTSLRSQRKTQWAYGRLAH